jgi:hypothetical protein
VVVWKAPVKTPNSYLATKGTKITKEIKNIMTFLFVFLVPFVVILALLELSR